MSATLNIPSKQSPFPFAAAAIAANGKFDINIDDSATAINLEIDGSSISDEEVIVQILAKEMGLSEDSEKAMICSTVFPWLIKRCIDPKVFCLGKNTANVKRLPGDRFVTGHD